MKARKVPRTGAISTPPTRCAASARSNRPSISPTPIKARLPALKIAWRRGAETIVNNGHTIQLNTAPGSALKVGHDSFALLQFHFHHPSEHTINGKHYPMEAHFVHRNAAGTLAVVGVLMTAGKSNATFSKIVATMPAHHGASVKAPAGIDPNKLLPSNRAYYRYEGSLTTPPCSEVVNWLLLRTPIEVAKADIDTFAKIFPMNARPVQKVDRRFVLSS